MGRHTEQKQHEGISMEKSNPNRKWVKMLNVLDYHRWNYVKKMLPHKKHGEGKDGYEAIEGSEEEVKVGDKSHVCNGEVCTVNFQNSHPEEKATKESARKGRAARIRAKIAKEVLKKRVRHRRSSTCPTCTGLTEHNSCLDVQPVNEPATADEEILHTERSLALTDTSFADPLVDGENAMEKGTQFGENSTDDLESSDEEEQPFPLKLKNIEHLGRSATFHQSKELLDAMDVLSMNKNFFLKVLVDPEASLAQHFMVQHASFKKKNLDKSRTFPRPCPLEGKDSCSSLDSKPDHKTSLEDNSRKSFSHNFPASPQKDEVAGIHFKDLRQKIKHVIKESKEETNRIAMDSVLHKVPYGQQYSESKKDALEQLNDLEKNNNNKKDHSVNRWPSLNESMEKYCQLIETSLTRQSKNTTSSDSVKLRVKDANGASQQEGQKPWGSLGRMSSSPDLLMCLRSPVAESHCVSPSRLPNGIPLPRRLMKASRSFNELNSQLMLSGFERSGIEEEVEEVVTSLGRDGDGESNATQSPTMRFEEPSPDFVPDSDSLEDSGTSEKPVILSEDSFLSQQTDLFSLTESTADPEKLEAELKSPHHVVVQSKDQLHFDYVKDVLKLSGYLENQALGTWQSKSQPMDSSLFTELEGCSLQEPDFCESEEGTTRCNRLLLFDSINEVLLSTYERSMAYWNSPLTNCSHIHPMPKGYCVLEQVWSHISWYLNSAANQLCSSLDHVIMHDLGEDDGWMNLQFEAEGAVLEIENLIFEELLMEVMPS